MALRLAGARVLQLSPAQPQLDAPWQGAVITGGHDIDPVLYAETSQVEPRYDAARDQLESAVIDRALADRQPVLGICRGAQLLNVRMGGSLHQRLREIRRHTSNRRTLFPLKQVWVTPESRLANTLGCTYGRINSLHNQGIDRLGAGLVVSARDQDQIVQGIEAPDHPFLIGVQWHPEFMLWQARSRRLFHALVDAVRKQAGPSRAGNWKPADTGDSC